MVEIKARVDASAKAVGLGAYNLSKFPGTFHLLPIGTGIDGRFLTGFDPEAVSVLSIQDKNKRDAKIKELSELKAELERLSGLNLSANPTNEYWLTQMWDISPKQLDMALWSDRVFYLAGLANNWFVKEQDFVEGDPKMHYVKFIASERNFSDNKRISKHLKFDMANAELLALYKADSKLKFEMVCKYILAGETKINLTSIEPGILWEMTRDWISKSEINAERFVEVSQKSAEDMYLKLKIDEAINAGVIKYRDGYFQRGLLTYGKTREEVVKYMSQPANAIEFSKLEEELQERLNLPDRYKLVNMTEAVAKADPDPNGQKSDEPIITGSGTGSNPLINGLLDGDQGEK